MEGDSGPQAGQQGEASLVVGRPGACPSSDRESTPFTFRSLLQDPGSCPSGSPFPAKDAVPGPTAGVLFPKLWVSESPAVPRGSVTTMGHPSPSQIPAPRAQRPSFSLAVPLGMSPTPRAPAWDRWHHLGLCVASPPPPPPCGPVCAWPGILWGRVGGLGPVRMGVCAVGPQGRRESGHPGLDVRPPSPMLVC